MLKTQCSRPLVIDPMAKLSRGLRNRWLPVEGLYVEVVQNRFDVYGDVWPMVYRVPPDVDPTRIWPGMPILGEPVEIGELLAYVAPFLVHEDLLVAVTGERRGAWSVIAGEATVKRFIPTLCNATQMCIKMTYKPSCSMLMSGTPQIWAFDQVDIGRPTICPDWVRLGINVEEGMADLVQLHLHKKDALGLGLALVQAAAGSYNSADVLKAYGEHKFLVDSNHGDSKDV